MIDHRMAVMLVISSARVVGAIDLDDAIQKAERALDMGPILDPTLWIQKHKDLESDLEILRAALPLWQLVKTRGADFEAQL